jgi:hypothetical protein
MVPPFEVDIVEFHAAAAPQTRSAADSLSPDEFQGGMMRRYDLDCTEGGIIAVGAFAASGFQNDRRKPLARASQGERQSHGSGSYDANIHIGWDVHVAIFKNHGKKCQVGFGDLSPNVIDNAMTYYGTIVISLVLLVEREAGTGIVVAEPTCARCSAIDSG